MRERFEKLVETLFGLDVRGLALARISFGLLILADLFNRARSLTAHYTGLGVLPREAMEPIGYLDWSLHFLSGSTQWQALLFVIAGAFAVMLVLGYRTRVASIVSWILLVSLQNANPVVLQGGDIAFRMALFWGMFVPWGAVFSLDARRRGSADAGMPIVGVVTAAWILNVAMIYIGSAALKNDPAWFGTMATAVESALHIDQFATHFALFARSVLPPVFLIGVTNLVFFTQMLAPLAFFVPSRGAIVRGVAAGGLMLMHASFLPFMRLGLFPFIDIAFLLPLLPARFFDFVFRKMPQQVKRFLERAQGVREQQNILVVEVLAILFLLLSIIVNVRSHGPLSIRLPTVFERIIVLTRLDQYWNMFSPYPLTDDGWYVMPGLLANGTRVDVFDLSRRSSTVKTDENAEISFEKPKLVSADYPTQRWRKYMMNLWLSEYSSIRPSYAAWLCREWNKEHEGDERLEEVEIVFMREDTDLSDPNPSAYEVSLGTYQCE